jgi:hypothetical protein
MRQVVLASVLLFAASPASAAPVAETPPNTHRSQPTDAEMEAAPPVRLKADVWFWAAQGTEQNITSG